MASHSLVSDAVDPLHSLFGVSLFPRTIRASTNASMPSNPKDLDSIHHFMKSVTLNRPEKLLDEAKAIVDGGSELLKSKFANFVESMGIDKDAVLPEGKENPQERRPGLGRKRARFNLKPNSRPSVSLESSLDIDQLKDPEEFFSAFEKAENAKREIQRQKGGVASDSDKFDPSTNTRSRRPGILGKSVSYKHRYSSLLSEGDCDLISSQDTMELDLPGAPNYESQEDNADADTETQERNVAGSITKTESRVNEILDELLSRSSKDFDGDGALSLLQERLKIKPIDLGKLSIPDFHDVGRADFLALREKQPKVRKTLSNISNLAKRTSGEAHVKQKKVGESPISSIASPTPLKSPFASISLLKKRSAQCGSLRDPFSPLNVDFSEPRNAHSVEDSDGQAVQVPVLKELNSGSLESHVENESGRPTISSVDLMTVIAKASDGPVDGFLDKNLGRKSIDVDIRATGSQMDFVEHDTGDGLLENSNWRNTSRVSESNDSVADRCEPAAPSLEINSNADDTRQIGSDAVVFIHRPYEVEGMPLGASAKACPEANIPQLQVTENLYVDQPLLAQPSFDATQDNPVVISSVTTEIMATKKSKKLQLKEQERTKRPRGGSRELKALSRGKTLTETGTSFESGVRKSKRIKTRPLEYWKGERFLYGYVGENLELIGLQYISPAKGDGKLKVKSYVSIDNNKKS